MGPTSASLGRRGHLFKSRDQRNESTGEIEDVILFSENGVAHAEAPVAGGEYVWRIEPS